MNSVLKKICIATLSVATFWVATAFGRVGETGNLHVVVSHYVGTRLMALDTASYKNQLGQTFTVTKFKYYMGKIHLQRVGGGDVVLNNYYLLNEEDEPSKTFTLSGIPAGEYTGVSFLVGVDSADNCSGAQAGALDPVNAMFWAWNTGYIFLKLEGKSSASTSPGHIFEYHIGGYKSPANCIRRISLSFQKPLMIAAGSEHELNLKADAVDVLQTPDTIDISKLSSVTDFHNAPTIANNYMDMFSVISVR